MKRKQFFGWMAATALTILMAGCGGKNGGSGNETAQAPSGNTAGESGGAGGSEVKSVTIGYLPNIVIPQPLIGLQNGEFQKAVPGVSFTGKDFPAGPEVMKNLRAGSVDIAYTGPYPPLKGFIKEGDIVLLSGAGSGGTELLIAKNSPIKSVKELKGKTIGVNQIGSTVDALVRHVVIGAGLSPGNDVKIVEIPPAQQADALSRGEVDAVAAPAPWPSTVRLNGGRPLLDWKQILDDGNYLQGVAFTTKRFAEANPNFVKQFVASHRAITDRLNKDRTKGDAEVLAAWSKVTKKTLKPEVAKTAFATIQYTNEAPTKGWERVMEIAVETGILKKKGDLKGFVYGE